MLTAWGLAFFAWVVLGRYFAPIGYALAVLTLVSLYALVPLRDNASAQAMGARIRAGSAGWLGTFILLFLVMHLYHFWGSTKHELYFHGPVINLYQEMKEVFTNPVWFTLYMIGLVSLLFHLLQGFQSAFQTFGINHRRWINIIKGIGVIYSWLICLLFASMPIAFMAGWLQ